MTHEELADFRSKSGMTQAVFGKWLADRSERDTPYSANVISRFESGRKPVPWQIAATIYKFQRDELLALISDT